jgi:putative glutathione S-transferase
LSAADWEGIDWATTHLLDAPTEAGRAHSPEDYQVAYERFFAALDTLESRLSDRRFYLGGAEPTGVDWWLFCLLARFDLVFYGLYKCNRTRLADFEHLPNYVNDVFQWTDIGATYEPEQIKRHYYWTEERINPKRLHPKGTTLDPWLPHDRGLRFGAEDLTSLGTEEDPNLRRRKGEWVRKRSAHRETITADGSSGYPAEAGRYHLYVALNCPWCHRVVLGRSLKGLVSTISMDVLFYRRHAELGWQFNPGEPGCTPDTIYGHQYLKQLYDQVGSKETSAPVLFDRKTETIVSNESAEILRMLNGAFGRFAEREIDLYPEEHRSEIDQLNAWIYTDINNGAYKAGFTNDQQAYEIAFDRFFAAMSRLDGIFAKRKFLIGDRLTEADVRLFPTMFRFDHVYYTRFRLNHKMVRDYVNLYRWLRDVYAFPGVAEASNLRHARNGYFGRTGNNIVPLGPDLSFDPTDA